MAVRIYGMKVDPILYRKLSEISKIQHRTIEKQIEYVLSEFVGFYEEQNGQIVVSSKRKLFERF